MSIRLTPSLSPRFAANLHFPDSNGSKADQKAEAQYEALFRPDSSSSDIDVFLHPVTQSVYEKLCDIGKLGDPVELKPIQNAKDIKHGFYVRDVIDDRFYSLALKKGGKAETFAKHFRKIMCILDNTVQSDDIKTLEKDRKDVRDFVRTLLQ